jgi:dUTP pyrophosphatase
MREVMVQVERLPHGADLPLPAYATAGAAGVDLMAATEVLLEPGAHAAIPTGLRLALPEGTEAQVRPRSGLALRHAVTVLNAPGTIDSDYRGEIKVILINHGRESFQVQRGMRIAQLVFAAVGVVRWQEGSVSQAGTARGSGGFGSTGSERRQALGADEGQPC